MSKRKDRFVVGEPRDSSVHGRYAQDIVPFELAQAKEIVAENELRGLIIYELVPYTPKKRGKKQ